MQFIDFGIHKDIMLTDWQTDGLFGEYVLDTYMFIKMTKRELNEMSNTHYRLPYMVLNDVSVDNLTHRLLVVIYSGTMRRLTMYFCYYKCYFSSDERNFQRFRFIVEYIHFCIRPVWKSLDMYLRNKIIYRGYAYFTDILHMPKFTYTKGKNYEHICELAETIKQKITETNQLHDNYGIHSTFMCFDEGLRQCDPNEQS